LKAILGKEEYNPISVMNETILSERYDPVVDIVKDYLLT
jgi:hypothetical protein